VCHDGACPAPTFQPPYATLQPASWHSHYPSDELGDRILCYSSCILWYKRTNAAAETPEEHSQRNEISKEWASMNQHPPVHQLAVLSTGWGWDFSSSGWMCIYPCLPFWCWPFPRFFCFWLLVFFFSTLTSPAQLHTTQPSWSYLLLLRTMLHPFLTYLPTRPLPPFPTQKIHPPHLYAYHPSRHPPPHPCLST